MFYSNHVKLTNKEWKSCMQTSKITKVDINIV